MRRHDIRFLLAGGVALGMIGCLSACGSSSTAGNTTQPSQASNGSSTGTSTSTRAGIPFAASAFATVVPDGWKQDPHPCGDQPNVLMCVYATSATGNGAVAVIQVMTLPSPVAESSLASALDALVGKNCAQDAQTGSETVGGDNAVAVTYNTNPSDAAATQNEDVAVNHGGQTYDVSLTVRAGDSYATYSSAFHDVLSSWSWK